MRTAGIPPRFQSSQSSDCKPQSIQAAAPARRGPPPGRTWQPGVQTGLLPATSYGVLHSALNGAAASYRASNSACTAARREAAAAAALLLLFEEGTTPRRARARLQ